MSPQLKQTFVGIGLTQAMTLYEPAFAVVTRRYGAEARSGIPTLTLRGGFASTVFVPAIQVPRLKAGPVRRRKE